MSDQRKKFNLSVVRKSTIVHIQLRRDTEGIFLQNKKAPVASWQNRGVGGKNLLHIEKFWALFYSVAHNLTNRNMRQTVKERHSSFSGRVRGCHVILLWPGLNIFVNM